MYILGINAYHADVSAVLLRDGQLVVALEEERFRRVKHFAGFPTIAIQKSLEYAGIAAAELNHIAISRDPRAHFFRKVQFALTNRPQMGHYSHVLNRLKNTQRVRDMPGPLAAALGLSTENLPPIHKLEHHPAHLASAFFVSPFDDAAVCALDAFGDFVSTSLAVGEGNRLSLLDRVYFPHTLGIMYTAVTQYLGFMGFGDEFKVMGLAPYGSPKYVRELRQLVRLRDDGLFTLDLDFFLHWSSGVKMEWDHGYPNINRLFSPRLEALLGPPRRSEERLTERHEDIAHSLQVVFEEGVFHVLNGLWKRTRNPRLCLAGGCAMNSVANGKIREKTPFRNVYIQPAAADNGTALGAAYYVWHQMLGQPRSFVMNHAYWGTEYSAPDLSAFSEREDDDWRYDVVRSRSEDELCRKTATLIAEGNIVGWFQGRMEWGARALGSRSILADPRRADMRELINTKIKLREKFRPFAPSILEKALDEYFVDAAPDPFMQQVYPVKPEKRAVIPAVTHVDGSGRLQTVSEATNPLYYRLIKEFERITGIPILLNTSFNENEPIVDTPLQALDCFLRTRMDVLVLNDTIVRRAAPAG